MASGQCELCGERAYFVLTDGRGFCTALHMRSAIGSHIRWVALAEEDGVRTVQLLSPLTDPHTFQPRRIT